MSTGGGGSDDDNGNRTVFRPSPLQGLRKPEPAQGTAFVPSQGQYQQADSQPQQAAYAPANPPIVMLDDDVPRPAQAPVTRNPMMAAAAQALALAASMRSGRVQTPLAQIHAQVSQVVAAFDRTIAPLYNEEQRRRARYAVAATFDDIAQNLPGQANDGAEWARRSMVVQFFSENIGGDRFWQLVEDMLRQPHDNRDLIELFHACLAAGFEGRFRIMPDGKRRLHEIMTQLYAVLEHPRSLSQLEMAPHWRGEDEPMRKVGFWTRILMAAGAAAGILLLIYLILRLILAQAGGPSMQGMRGVNPEQPLGLSRVAPAAAAPPSAQATRLQQFLAPEISQGLVTVESDGTTVRVRTTVGQLFKSGSDELEPGRRNIFERIAAGVEGEPGDVSVDGHADSDRIATVTFPDNLALSKARAGRVAEIIKGGLSNPGRVSSQGFGDSQPIASNDTAAGKSQNRRVEVVIPRSE